METIIILHPGEQSNLSTVACIVGTVEVFRVADTYWKKQGRSLKYRLVIASTQREEKLVRDLVSVKTDVHISEISSAKLVIIPSALPIKSTDEHPEMLDWIKKLYKSGSEVASMCSGAFLLASTGILDGKSCSTHWSLTDVFRDLFPRVNLSADKLITDENGIYTNGGAYSFLNLMVYLVEKYYDRQTAVYCSKVLQIQLERNSQSAFSIFTGQKQHEDEVIQLAQQFIEENIDEKISFTEMSSRFAVGRRNFDRRFIKATGNTPLEYAQRVRIESAKKALENTRKTVNEVMYEVGYSDVKAFREVFRKITGISPLEYRQKYNKGW